MMKNTTFRISDKMARDLVKFAKRAKKTRSAVIREALEKILYSDRQIGNKAKEERRTA